MKRILSSLFVGVVGGVIALSANYYLHDNPNFVSSSNSGSNYQATPVSYSGASVPQGVDFTNSAERTVNSVVHIKTITEASNNLNYDPFQDWFFGTQPRQSQIQQGSGSGVIISQDGYIVTNNHVVNGADKIEVVLNDKRSYSAEVVGTDPTTDIALIRVKDKDLPAIGYGNSDNVKVGEWVLAVGNPFNLNSTVTAGIVSAKGRNINMLEGSPQRGVFPIESFIQTDAAVNPGNSGGALVNVAGELVGINTAIASNNGAYQGYAFAIPVNIVKKVVADLVEFGTVQRAFIGVSINDIDARFAEQKHISQLRGAYVNGLSTGGAAENAGIQLGDVITAVEGVNVKSVAELQEQIGKFRPGNKVKVAVLRNGKEVVLPVILKNKDNTETLIKKEEPARTSVNSLGAVFEELDANTLARLKLDNGVRIAKLNTGKLASAGIKEGFVITSIDKKKVAKVQEIQDALENKTGGVLIEGVYPNGMRAYYGFGM